jgi:FdhD protein
VDLPFASAPLFRLLADLRKNEDAVVPVTSDGPQPLHAVFARMGLPRLERALVDGRLSVNGVMQDLAIRLVGRDQWGATDPSGRFAININSPDDLSLIEDPR